MHGGKIYDAVSKNCDPPNNRAYSRNTISILSPQWKKDVRDRFKIRFFSFRRETDRLHPDVAALRVAGLSMGAPTSEIGPSHQIVVAAILPELGAKADIARTVVNARLQPSHTLLIDWPRSSGPATW
jgi:hypothetical protein